MSSRCGRDSQLLPEFTGSVLPRVSWARPQRELPPRQTPAPRQETVASEQRAFLPDTLSAATCLGPQKEVRFALSPKPVRFSDRDHGAQRSCQNGQPRGPAPSPCSSAVFSRSCLFVYFHPHCLCLQHVTMPPCPQSLCLNPPVNETPAGDQKKH